MQKRKIIWSCQGSNLVPPASSLVTILTELQYSTVFVDIKISGPHVTFQELRLLQECKSGLQNTDGTIIIVSQSYLDNYEGSVGTLLRCSLRANHRCNSVFNLYVSVITATKGIVFKICFMFQTDTFGFINPLNPELNPICYLLALLGAHHFLHVSRKRVKLLTLRRLMSYIYIWSTHF